MADSEDTQCLWILWDEPRQAPLRATRKYYFNTSDSDVADLTPIPETHIRVVLWSNWQAPLRAARQYYFGAASSGADETDSGLGYVISSYGTWRAAPHLLRYLWHRAEDGASIAADIPWDQSGIFGRYRPSRYRVSQLNLYHGTAQDASAPAIEFDNMSMVVGMRYRATHYRPLPFHRLIQYGDEGVVVVPPCPPRSGSGTPTTAGLARYARSTVAVPRPASDGDVCQER